MNSLTSFYRYANSLLVVILLVGLSWVYPYLSQVNAGLSFYSIAGHLWPLIVGSCIIGLVILAINSWILKDNKELAAYYNQLVTPYVFYALISLMLWAVALVFDFQIVVLLAIGLFVNHTHKLVQYVSGTAPLRQKPMLIKYPIGWLNGMSYSLAILSLSIYAQNAQLELQGMAGELWGIVWIVIGLAISAYQYVKYGNPFTMLASLLFNLAVVVRHIPIYQGSNSSILIAGSIIWLLAAALFIYLCRTQHRSQ